MHEKMQTYCKKKLFQSSKCMAKAASGLKGGEMEGKQGKLSNAKRKKVQLKPSKYRNLLYF